MISYENINAELISEGTYGITYKIKKDNDIYCIKQYKQKNSVNNLSKGFADDMIRDITHNISSYSKISLFGINYEKKYIIMTYYPQTISVYINDNKFTQNTEWLNDFKTQILTQVYILHSHGFVHSDIKLENILYKKMPTGENKFTLCDFGLTEYYGYPRIIKDYQCTEYFKIEKDVAPIDETNNTINTDIYSIGACIYYLTSGLINGYSHHITYDTLKSNKYTIEQFIQMKELCKFILPELAHNTKSILGIKSYLKPNERKNTNAIISKVGQIFPFHISLTKAFKFNLSCKLFNKLLIKRNVANYTFQEIYEKRNEISYLDDMYSVYRNYKIRKPNGSPKNKYTIKYNILEIYLDTKSSIESLFFSFHLTDMLDVVFLNKNSANIIINFTFKILEYQSFRQKNINENTITDLETILINNVYSKQSIFIPIGFLIYYYITKIAQTYPVTYYSLLGQLESIALSMAILFFIDYTYVYQTMIDLTYADICYHIVVISLDFILNETFIRFPKEEISYLQSIIHQCRINACKMTNDTIIFKIIEDENLYACLTNSMSM